MKKSFRILLTMIVGTVLLSGVVMAAAPLKLFINENEFNAVPFKLKIENGTIMVSLRSIVEQLNGSVAYSNNTVKITMPEATQLANQNKRLEDALLASTPEDAVQTWIKGVQTRNGALQYAVLSTDLRKATKKQFEAANWVTGVSSPHMGEVKKLNTIKVDENTVRIDFEYPLVATGWESSGKAELTVKHLNDPERGEGWFITQIKLADPGDTGVMIGAVKP